MTVFSIGGSLSDGYYFWNGSKWIRLTTGDYGTNLVSKSANCTLLKTETLVLASNDITLTLPAVTADDNGLAITIKNNGGYLDLITVAGASGAVMDNVSNFYLTRYQSKTFVAYNGAWIVKEREMKAGNTFEVGAQSSWTTVAEIVAFLNEHMMGPSVVRFCCGTFTVPATQVINLPYPVTFEATSYGTTTVGPEAGLSGKPMFICKTECYFKMLMFDASSYGSYGTSAGENAVHLSGSGTYNEIKDCTFDGFYNAIVDSTDAELWLFECDMSNINGSAILIQSPVSGPKIRVSETDFMNCRKGVEFSKGTGIIAQLDLGAYDNANATDTCIKYNSANCTFSKMQINYNAWNNIGVFLSGFDFSLANGRDADAFIESNAGIEDKTPHCKINVKNNSSVTTVTTANTWYKCQWTNSSSYPCKWAVANNRITYLPNNKRDAVVFITGNISCNYSNRVISIGLVKNGVSSTRYGECDLRITTGGQPFQFSTVIYIEDVSRNDYFELFCTSNTSGDQVTFQDVQWYTEVN
jgi:hypothetical protein